MYCPKFWKIIPNFSNFAISDLYQINHKDSWLWSNLSFFVWIFQILNFLNFLSFAIFRILRFFLEFQFFRILRFLKNRQFFRLNFPNSEFSEFYDFPNFMIFRILWFSEFCDFSKKSSQFFPKFWNFWILLLKKFPFVLSEILKNHPKFFKFCDFRFVLNQPQFG